MSILEIGKRKNITQTIVNIVKSSKEFPFIVTNKDLPIIEESAYVIEAIEKLGYKVETFTDNDKYGIKVSKK